jgi:hypothetical protein
MYIIVQMYLATNSIMEWNFGLNLSMTSYQVHKDEKDNKSTVMSIKPRITIMTG